MSNRSPRFGKSKQTSTQDPATRPAPQSRQRPLRAVPPSGHMPERPRPLAGGHDDTRVMAAIRESDTEITAAMTRVLPKVSPANLPPARPHAPLTLTAGLPAPSLVLDAVREAELELDATQVLPVVRALLDGPPSQYWERTHAVHSDEDQPDVDNRTPEQINAHADAMASEFDKHMAEMEAKSRRRDRAIADFAKRWQHDDAHWARVAQTLKAKQEATDAGRLAVAYEAGGTSVALFTAADLAHEIAQRALAGSAVTR